jgi:hypothetical protein
MMSLCEVGLLPAIQHLSTRPIVQHKNLLAFYIFLNTANLCECSMTVIKTSLLPFYFHAHMCIAIPHA